MRVEIQKITFSELVKNMQDYNDKYGVYHCCSKKEGVADLFGVVVYKQESFTKPYSLASRSYLVMNRNGKLFTSFMSSRSIFGDALDGTDDNVRLDYYDWDIEYCYMLPLENKPSDELVKA